MAVELNEAGKVLVVTLSDKLSKDDYKRFTPAVERAVKEQGKIRMLVRMHSFHGWSMGALWEDVKFDLRRRCNYRNLAT